MVNEVKNGPYDVIIGHSQGAALIALIDSLRYETGKSCHYQITTDSICNIIPNIILRID